MAGIGNMELAALSSLLSDPKSKFSRRALELTLLIPWADDKYVLTSLLLSPSLCVCMCVCVHVCARARTYVCVSVYVSYVRETDRETYW